MGGLRVLALLLLAAFSLLVIFPPPFADNLRNTVFDGYQRLFKLERTTAPAIIVAVDEATLAQYGQWPWPRSRMAELLRRIAEQQPAAIGLDIFFTEPDRFSPPRLARDIAGLSPEAMRELSALPSSDGQLADAMRGQRVVLGIAGSDEVDPRFPAPPRNPPVVMPGDRAVALQSFAGHLGDIDEIDAAAESHGLMTSGEVSTVVRVVPMVARVQGVEVPSLGVETLRAGLDRGVRLVSAPWGLLTLRVGNLETTIQENGTAWLRMGHHDESRFVSAATVISGKIDPELLKGKVVLVGVTGLALLDYKTTPLGESVPGVEVHAQVVENVYNGVELLRPPIAPRIEAAVLIACGFLVIGLVPRMNALRGINLAAGLVVLLFCSGLLAFLYLNMLFDPAWPAIGTTAVFLAVIVGSLRVAESQRRQLRDQAARMAGEVDAARRIQMGLLPDPRETLGYEKRFSIAAFLEPARTVGGDFYDCFMVDAHRLFFVVADVSGKGLPAALFMASVKSQLKSAALRGGSAGEILSRAQADIARENPEQLFVTMFAGLLDASSGALEYANAGHEPPFARRGDGTLERFEKPGGPPVCVIEDFEFPTSRRKLAPGEWLCLVTDGITEAMNPECEFFTVERLRTLLASLPAAIDPEQLVAKVHDTVLRFAAGAEPADDLTLLVVRWNR